MKKLILLLQTSGLVVCARLTAAACSTFVLEDGSQQIFAHHLDTGGDVPGLVVINKRETQRSSASWNQLITAQASDHAISWKSRWGSITFNTWGIGYPDGGLNERGLYIQEMSLPGSVAPSNSPTALFAPVWMQYVLDNFVSTAEVVRSVSRFTIQGNPSPMEWHYLVADREGNKALIEFIGGNLVVNQEKAMPLPLLCNAPYAEELKRWKTFADAGTNASLPKGDVRFIRGAKALASTTAQGTSFDRTVQVLNSLKNSGTQWTYIFDVSARRVMYRTKRNSEWREFNWTEDRFAPGPALAWDINESRKEIWFQPISDEENARFAGQAVDALLKYAGGERFEKYLQSLGGSSQNLRKELADASRWR